MSLPIALLAGGLATRLRPLTDSVPKSLIGVAGKPFIFHQLEWLSRQGIGDVILCVGHRGEEIKAAVGDGKKWGLRVRYSYDGPSLRGTAGAVRGALSLLGEAFFVMYGDSYLRCDLAAIEAAFHASGKRALMTVLRNDGRWDNSNVLMDRDTLVRYDKGHPTPDMRHIDYGLGVLSKAAFAYDPQATDLAEVYESLSQQGQLAACLVQERFYEIGSPQGLAETREFLEKQTLELH